jgi:hypothetical protein
MPHNLDCFCDVIRACEERVIAAAVHRVEAYEYISTIGVVLSSVVPKAAVIALIKGDSDE